jgi:hypothetical protein
VKQALFAAFALHRYLVGEVYTFVLMNETLCAEAVGEVREYVEFIRRQRALNKATLESTSKKIRQILAKYHPDLEGEE